MNPYSQVLASIEMRRPEAIRALAKRACANPAHQALGAAACLSPNNLVTTHCQPFIFYLAAGALRAGRAFVLMLPIG